MQLWRKIGDPAPVDESDFEFVNEFTRTRMTLGYQMTQGGQTVYYQARWGSPGAPGRPDRPLGRTGQRHGGEVGLTHARCPRKR